MNWVILVVAAFLIIMAIRGYKQGFIRILMSFLATIIAAAVVWFAAPYVKEALIEYTSIDEKLQAKTEAFVEELIMDQITKPEDMNLPEALWDVIEVEILNGVQGAAEPAADYLTSLLLSAIVYVGLYILVLVLLRILMHVMDLITRLPVLHEVNGLLGLGLSLVEALIFLWIACLIVTIFADTEIGMKILQDIGRSQFLTFIYDENILLKLVQRLAA